MTDIHEDAAMRLLLVEDDPESGAALQLMLERRGVEVEYVLTADDALAALDPERFDIVVADILLGDGMNGVDLLREIRTKLSEFPVILLTAHDSLETAIEAVRLGAQDYILKPLDAIEDLLRPVQRVVANHRLLLRNRALERDLLQGEARFRAVLENSIDVVFRYDLNGHCFEYISPACERVHGFSRTELESLNPKSMAEHTHPDDRQAVETAFCRETISRLSADEVAPVECRIRMPGGGFRWFSITRRLLSGGNGHGPAVIGAARDITESKHMQAREQELRDKLARAARLESLGELAGTVAHDVNNILGPLILIPEILLKELHLRRENLDQVKMDKGLTDMRNAVQHAVSVVRNLLDLGRRGTFEPEEISLNQLVDEYVKSPMLEGLKGDYPHVDVKTVFGTDLLPVEGSVSHLTRVLMNLTINAFEAMPEGGTLKLTTENIRLDAPLGAYQVVPAGEHVVLRVADSGTGIPRESLDRIFEPFYSSKKRDTRSGSGLGLAVVFGVIRDHKGFIDVKSTPGQGTEFSVYLPVSGVASSGSPVEEDVAVAVN